MAVKTLNRGNDPYWRQVERAVVFIEMAIDPDARVEHDVRLWEKEAKEWVQCDVVIRRGPPSRETLAIVEVQARKAKVDRKTFNAWCVKRDNVLAQQLICVSEKGFERPVVESARGQGNAVRLVTFRQVDHDTLPVKFDNGQLRVSRPKFAFGDYSVVTDDSKCPGNPFKGRDVEFSLNGEPIDMDAFFEKHSKPISPPKSGKETHTERLEFEDDEIVMMSWAGDSARVRSLTRQFTVESEDVFFSLSSRSYFQLEYDGMLAWYVAAVGQVDGEHAVMHLIMREQNGQVNITPVVTDAFEKMLIHSLSFSYMPPVN